MQRILIVTADSGRLENFAQGLQSGQEVDLCWAADGRSALELAAAAPTDLAVVDERVDNSDGLALIRQLLQADAWIHTAVVSRLDESDFHEASEGLGVLACLPVEPDADDGRRLRERLDGLPRRPPAP